MNNDNLFEQRRQKLHALDDTQLEQRFHECAGSVVAPMVELARTHTSPSIERSVLLRMGFSSLESQALVRLISEAGRLGKGAGHVVMRAAQQANLPYLEAGRQLIQTADPQQINRLFP